MTTNENFPKDLAFELRCHNYFSYVDGGTLFEEDQLRTLCNFLENVFGAFNRKEFLATVANDDDPFPGMGIDSTDLERIEHAQS